MAGCLGNVFDHLPFANLLFVQILASPQTGRVEVTSLHGFIYEKTPPVVLFGPRCSRSF